MSGFRKIGKSGRWEALQLQDISDGELSHHPPCPPYRRSNDENYLIQLGAAWVNHPAQHVNYYIERLPENYTLYEIDKDDGSQTYKRLFGHPSGRFYDSIVRFKVHFLWLMGGKRGSCECVLCPKGSAPMVQRQKRAPREVFDRALLRPKHEAVGTGDKGNSDDTSSSGIAARRARRDVKHSTAPHAVDEEGTEDVFKHFISRLRNLPSDDRGIDADFAELDSLDWRAEHHDESLDLLPNYLTQIDQQPAYIPRIGEIVLFISNFLDGHYLLRDNKDRTYKFFAFSPKRFSGHPDWRAGVITAAPNEDVQNGSADFEDLLESPRKQTALNTAGFRVETLPDPNDTMNKSVSKQYKLVPLRNIRPMAQWQMLLHGIPEEKLHPSIYNALTCATSFSLLEKFKATGMWRFASIRCKGIFLGPELITVGDTVRLCSQTSASACTDILKVESIRLNLEGMELEHASKSSPLLASKSWVSFVGKAYTSVNVYTTLGKEAPVVPAAESKALFRSVGAREYGPWYHLHDPRSRFEVSYDQVLGKLCEADAVRLWTGQIDHRVHKKGLPEMRASLDYDVSGIVAARAYASKVDARLPEGNGDEISWFWADTRAEALAVESFNGLEVGKHWSVRDKATLGSWNAQMKILNGITPTQEVADFVAPPKSTRGRKPGSKMINGKLYHPGDPEYDEVFGAGAEIALKPSSQMAGAAFASTDEDSMDEGADLEAWTGMPSNWKNVEGDEGVAIYEPEIAETQVLERQSSVRESARRPEATKAHAPLLKTQIMSNVLQSIEGDDAEDYDDISSQGTDYLQPLLARGGTEESEGSDYDPSQFSHGPGRGDGDDEW